MRVMDIVIAAFTPNLRKSKTRLMTGYAKQRTCIVCRSQSSKNDYLRVVKTPEGTVNYDPTGRANGRGAYLCSVSCFEKAITTHRLAGALRTKMNDEDYERVAEQLVSALSDENK